MQTVKGQHFTAVEVSVDDTEFIDCKFIRCGLVYRGGMFRFDPTCKFDGVSFQFRDAALRTFQFMQGFGMAGDKRLIVGNDAKPPN